MVTRLLAVESPDEPTEIVIHVNMLKEGWDVTNLLTIVHLRAANARILIERSLGRGLRLPYGRKRVGVASVDRLSIVAHDRFQEIVDEANRPDSPLKLQTIELEAPTNQKRTQSVSINSNLAYQLASAPAKPHNEMGSVMASTPASRQESTPIPQPVFGNTPAQQIASQTFEVLKQFEYLPRITDLQQPEIKAKLVSEVLERYVPIQPTLDEADHAPDVHAIVDQVISLVIEETIEIPRIVVVPKGDVSVV